MQFRPILAPEPITALARHRSAAQLRAGRRSGAEADRRRQNKTRRQGGVLYPFAFRKP